MLDWDKIREDYARRATPAELDSPFGPNGRLKKTEPKEPKEAKPRPNRRKREYTGKGRKQYDHLLPDIILLYGAGKTVTDIATKFSINPQTVRNYLKSADVYDATRDRRGGLPRREMCFKGIHRLADDYYVTASGGRGCKQCKRDRDREAWRRRAEAKKKSM